MLLLNLLPIMITVFGIVLLFKLRCFFLIHPVRVTKRMLFGLRDRASRRALTLALAGTLGVGNIVGVAHGVSVGGAGALFWLLVSSIFSAVIKYAEITLATDKLSDNGGGMMYVIGTAYRRVGRVLGALYAVLCLMLSLTMGSALQSQSAAASAGIGSPFCSFIISLGFTLIVATVIIGGAEKIENATSVIIPISTIIYIFICLFVILSGASRLPSVISRVFSDAFDFRACIGGVSSFAMIKAVREGYARGLLSNEAGAGTSAAAQVRSKKEPADAGLLGICEVFFDTVLLCPLTGLAVLVGCEELSGSGMEIVLRTVTSSFGALSELATLLVFFPVFAFALSTVICWYYYGTECTAYLFRTRRSLPYTLIFIAFSLLGFLIPSSYLIAATDYILFFMSLLTLFTLIKSSARIVHLTKQSGLIKFSEKSDV